MGDGDFVEQLLSATREQVERKYALVAQGYDLDKIVDRISYLVNLEPSYIRPEGKERRRVAARSLLCYWAVRELGISMAELTRQLNRSIAGISLSVKRAEKIAQDKDYKLMDN